MNDFQTQISQIWSSAPEQPKSEDPMFYHTRLETGESFEIRGGISYPRKYHSVFIGIKKYKNAFPKEKILESVGMIVTPISYSTFSDEYYWIAIECKMDGRESIFLQMVNDLDELLKDFDTVKQPLHLFYLLINEINAWQQFFMKEKEGVLPFEQAMGLWGELVVFENLIKKGVSALYLVKSWKGPEHGAKDFLFKESALEIKTNIVGKTIVHINSIEQLDTSATPNLFLALVEVKNSRIGRTLPELIDSILLDLDVDHEAKALFKELLYKVGYNDLYRIEYIEKFTVESLKLFPVDESFPRITRSNTNQHIKTVQYDVDLSATRNDPFSIAILSL
jgi:hypothetical protein